MPVIEPKPLLNLAPYLRQLCWLRLIATPGQLLILLALHYGLQIPMPLHWMLPLALIPALAGGLSLRWLKQDRRVVAAHMGLQLLLDNLQLAALLYFSGGWGNPCVTLMLLPVCLAAALLPRLYCWALVIATLGLYWLLVLWHLPLATSRLWPQSGMLLHMGGMWFTFVLSALLLATFVAGLANRLRSAGFELNQLRENELRHQQLLGLASLAANTAHALGTPLSSMSLLADELAYQASHDQQLPLQQLKQQIQHCREQLQRLAIEAGQNHASGGQAKNLHRALTASCNSWQLLHPANSLRLQCPAAETAPFCLWEHSLEQILFSLLDNAARQSTQLELDARWSETELWLDIRDFGAGFSADHQPSEGLGLGLYLARETLASLGGDLKLDNHPQQGGIARIYLPLKLLELL